MYCGNCGRKKIDAYCEECKKKTLVTLSGFYIPQIPMSFDESIENYSMVMFRSGHIMHELALENDTPFGNLDLVFTNILNDIEHLNKRIREAFYLYANGMYFDLNIDIKPTDHAKVCEEVIYWMRRIVDRLIMIHWLVYEFSINGRYPKQIKIESIGKLLEIKDSKNEKDLEGKNFLKQYNENDFIFLIFLKEASNAYKHSIFNGEATSLRIGQNEPLVISLNLKHNNIEKPQIYCHDSLSNVVWSFIEFYKQAREKITKSRKIL